MCRPQVEELPDNRVRLTVEVPSHDVHHAVEHAASDLAERVKIPGFRKGKVPMQVLVQRIGKERLYSEAVESHIGGWFWNAAAQIARSGRPTSPSSTTSCPASDDEDWQFTATFAGAAEAGARRLEAARGPVRRAESPKTSSTRS